MGTRYCASTVANLAFSKDCRTLLMLSVCLAWASLFQVVDERFSSFLPIVSVSMKRSAECILAEHEDWPEREREREFRERWVDRFFLLVHLIICIRQIIQHRVFKGYSFIACSFRRINGDISITLHQPYNLNEFRIFSPVNPTSIAQLVQSWHESFNSLLLLQHSLYS